MNFYHETQVASYDEIRLILQAKFGDQRLNPTKKIAAHMLKKNLNKIVYELYSLTHCRSMFPFYIPWKYQQASGFLVFPGYIEREYWPEISCVIKNYKKRSIHIKSCSRKKWNKSRGEFLWNSSFSIERAGKKPRNELLDKCFLPSLNWF